MTLEVVEPWTMLATRVLAPNAGPMTLDGTNSYVVRHPDSHSALVVDPGPSDRAHLHRLTALGPIELILVTHHHKDHIASARRLSEMTGAPVRTGDPTLCIDGAPLTEAEEILAGGTRIRVVAVPGHTADSMCFHLPEDESTDGFAANGSMLTGDTILGRGSSVIAQPDGSLRAYASSLERLRQFPETIVLPGHGPRLPDLAVVSAAYLEHRRARLAAVVSAVDELNQRAADVTVASVTDLVYPAVPSDVRFAAEASVTAQLDYLAEAAGRPGPSGTLR